MSDSLISTLRKDWIRIAESVVRKRGKEKKHLCFAKRAEYGYAFFIPDASSLDMLEEITAHLSALYPEVAYSEIAEASSCLANED